ncbi:MAG TPA: hypothetical protein VGQ83_11265 [Polyangia bacterium]|jgi:hypothetical protein
MRRVLAWSLCLAALLVAAPAGAKPRVAKDFSFDGFKLGDDYGRKVMTRAPYDAPCDNDPIDHQRRRFMVYGALPCRDRVFPDQTTVMFYLRFSKEAPYQQPIEAFAYLYGSYFNAKTDFPLKPGDALAKATKTLGAARGTLELTSRGVTLTAHRFDGDIAVIANGAVIVGFVLGPMPAAADNEQWRGLMQMYRRYTPKQ